MKIKKLIPYAFGSAVLAACATPAIIAGVNANKPTQTLETFQNVSYKYKFNDSQEFDSEKTLFGFFLDQLKIKQSSHFGSLNEDRAYLNKELGLINIDKFASSSDKIRQAYIKLDSPEDYLTHDLSAAQKTYVKTQIDQYIASDGSIWNSENAALQRNKELLSFINLSLYEFDTYYGKSFLNPLAAKDIEFFESTAINMLNNRQSTQNPFSIKVMTQDRNQMTMAPKHIDRLFNDQKNDWFRSTSSNALQNSSKVNEINAATSAALANVKIPISFASENRNNDNKKAVTTIVWNNSQNVGQSTNNDWLSAYATLDFLKDGLAEATRLNQTKTPTAGKYFQTYQVGSYYGDGGAPVRNQTKGKHWIGISLRFRTSQDYWVEMKNHNVNPSITNPTHYLFEWGFYPRFQVKGFQNTEATNQLMDILKTNFKDKVRVIFESINLSVSDHELNNIYSKLESDFKNTINNYTNNIHNNWNKEDGALDLISPIVSEINKILTNPSQKTIDTIVSAIVNKVRASQHLITIAYNDVPVFKINSNVPFDQKISNHSSLKDIVIDTISRINASTNEVENISQFITIEGSKIKYEPTKRITNGANYIVPNSIGLDHSLSKQGEAQTNGNGVYSSMYLFNKEQSLSNLITRNVLFLYDKSSDGTYKNKITKMGRLSSLEDKKLPYTHDKKESIIWNEADWNSLQSQTAPLPKHYKALLGISGEIIGRIALEKEGSDDGLYYQKLYQQIVSNIEPKISNEYFYVELENGSYKLIKNNIVNFYSFEFNGETIFFEDLNKALYYVYNRIFAPNVLRTTYVNDVLESSKPIV